MKKEDLLNFYKKYKFYIFPAIVVVSALILIISVIYPQAIKLIINQKTEGELTSKTKFLEAKAQILDGLDPTDLKQQVNSTLVSYPTDKDFVYALGLIQDLASQAGFNIVAISLGAGSLNKASTQSYAIKLDVSGSGNLLPRLISSIESSPRLMRVNSLETTSGKDSQILNISLNIDVLYSTAPKSFGNIDSPVVELSQQDQEVIAKLARINPVVSPNINQTNPGQLGPRGKANPFE